MKPCKICGIVCNNPIHMQIINDTMIKQRRARRRQEERSRERITILS